MPKLVCCSDDLILVKTHAQLFKSQAQLSILSHDLAQPIKIEPAFPWLLPVPSSELNFLENNIFFSKKFYFIFEVNMIWIISYEKKKLFSDRSIQISGERRWVAKFWEGDHNVWVIFFLLHILLWKNELFRQMGGGGGEPPPPPWKIPPKYFCFCWPLLFKKDFWPKKISAKKINSMYFQYCSARSKAIT